MGAMRRRDPPARPPNTNKTLCQTFSVGFLRRKVLFTWRESVCAMRLPTNIQEEEEEMKMVMVMVKEMQKECGGKMCHVEI